MERSNGSTISLDGNALETKRIDKTDSGNIYIYRRRVANKFLVSGARLKCIVGRVTTIRLDILNACFLYP